MNKVFFFFLFFYFISLFGCHIRSTDPIGADNVVKAYKQYKKIDEEKVMIYASSKFAPRHYEIVAQLKTNEDYQTLDLLIEAMQKKASELHANAVVVLGITPRTDGYPYVESENAKSLNRVVALPDAPVTQRIIGENSVATGTQIKKDDGEMIGNTYDPITNTRHYYSSKSSGSAKDKTYRGYALAIHVEDE